MKTLLVDADFLAFMTAAACQEVIKWDDDIITTHIDMRKAKDVFTGSINDYSASCGGILEDEDANIVLAWSDPARRYFRHEVCSTYKGNRKNGQPPLGLRDLRDWACTEWPSLWLPGLEGDDVLGLLATGNQLFERELLKRYVKFERVIVGVDKDLRQIPGVHFNPMRPDDGLVTVTPEEGKRLLALQTLMGDATDGYTGIPGVGPVKANKLLADVDFSDGATVWPAIVSAYEASKLTEMDAECQFNQARILLTTNYDFKNNRPRLWTPSGTSTSQRTAA